MTKTIISSDNNSGLVELADIWRYRDLLLILTWRDIKVRYRQTFIGVAWVVLQPLLTMVLFTFFFGKLARISSGELPYYIFVLIGLVFWNYFSSSLNHASNSLIEHENMIKKIYFPRIIIPLSSVITNLVDFGVNFLLLLVVLLFSDFRISPVYLLSVPFLLLISAITAFGSGPFLSSLNVKYRDVRYALPFFFQILIYVTPVIYPLSIVSPTNQILLALNPMTSVIEVSRSLLSESQSFNLTLLTISSGVAFFILILGSWYFKKTERFFADIA